MKIRDFDFRFIHMRFFKLFKDGEVLVFGYINKEKGLEFVVLDHFIKGKLEGSKVENTVFTYAEIVDFEIEALKYEDVNERLYEEVINKIIEENKVDYKLKETRELDLIDGFRDRANPDVLPVYLVNARGVEPVMVTLTEVLDSKIVGVALRSAVKSDVKKGDRVEFQVGNANGKRICIAYVS